MTATTPTTTPATLTADHRRTSATVGALSYALGVACTVPNADSTGEVVVVLAGAALVAVAVFGWVVPRGTAQGTPGTALGLSIAAALLVFPAFWSMLPLLLGVAGVLLGRAATGFAPRRAWTAVGLGALAVGGYLFLYLVLGALMGEL